jgi:hypothetical protein
MRNRNVVLAAAFLVLAGLALVLLAKFTPWHSSEEFYDLRDALEARAFDDQKPDRPDYDVLSQEFHALERRYGTNKWLYADVGYLLVALSLMTAILGVFGQSIGVIFRSTHHRVLVVGLFVVAYAGFFLGMMASAVHDIGRYQVPMWADSLGIPFAAAVFGAQMLALPTALFMLWPLARPKTIGLSLAWFNRKQIVGSTLATMIYGVTGVGLMLMAVSSALSSGSWLLTPSLLIMGWLALNDRVLLIAPEADLAPHPPEQVRATSPPQGER